MNLKAPFPWFGGKSRVAHVVWERFGDVVNYVEPFAGSIAVLLGRPHVPRNETVNDLDCYLSNFWRAVQKDPEAVASAADWPVNEADLHARHCWLHSRERFRERMHAEADFYDAEVAGVWVWGISCWIGDNWCRTGVQASAPDISKTQGINQFARDGTGLDSRRPALTSCGVMTHAKRPSIKKGCTGVASQRAIGCLLDQKISEIGQHGPGRGVNADYMSASRRNGLAMQIPVPQPSGVNCTHVSGSPSEQLPDISGDSGASGRGIHAAYARANLTAYMRRLAERLRYVRVCCGNWDRILGPSPTVHIGTTAVFLDPPYGDDARDKVYSHDSLDVSGEVRKWCVEHGDDERLRIALCGYAGEHDNLEARGWECLRWKASGGYGARNPMNTNGARERIWFSPHCLREDLFAL